MKRRSGEAQAAQHRKAGPMKHRLAPRGGAKDEQAELLDEAACEVCNYAGNNPDDCCDVCKPVVSIEFYI